MIENASTGTAIRLMAAKQLAAHCNPTILTRLSKVLLMSKSWDVRTAIEYALGECGGQFEASPIAIEDDMDRCLKLLIEFDLERFIIDHEALLASSGAVFGHHLYLIAIGI